MDWLTSEVVVWASLGFVCLVALIVVPKIVARRKYHARGKRFCERRHAMEVLLSFLPLENVRWETLYNTLVELGILRTGDNVVCIDFSIFQEHIEHPRTGRRAYLVSETAVLRLLGDIVHQLAGDQQPDQQPDAIVRQTAYFLKNDKRFGPLATDVVLREIGHRHADSKTRLEAEFRRREEAERQQEVGQEAVERNNIIAENLRILRNTPPA